MRGRGGLLEGQVEDLSMLLGGGSGGEGGGGALEDDLIVDSD